MNIQQLTTITNDITIFHYKGTSKIRDESNTDPSIGDPAEDEEEQLDDQQNGESIFQNNCL